MIIGDLQSMKLQQYQKQQQTDKRLNRQMAKSPVYKQNLGKNNLIKKSKSISTKEYVISDLCPIIIKDPKKELLTPQVALSNKSTFKFDNNQNKIKVDMLINPNINTNTNANTNASLSPTSSDTHNKPQSDKWICANSQENDPKNLNFNSNISNSSTILGINFLPVSPVFAKKPTFPNLKDQPENLVTEQLEENIQQKKMTINHSINTNPSNKKLNVLSNGVAIGPDIHSFMPKSSRNTPTSQNQFKGPKIFSTIDYLHNDCTMMTVSTAQPESPMNKDTKFIPPILQKIHKKNPSAFDDNESYFGLTDLEELTHQSKHQNFDSGMVIQDKIGGKSNELASNVISKKSKRNKELFTKSDIEKYINKPDEIKSHKKEKHKNLILCDSPKGDHASIFPKNKKLMLKENLTNENISNMINVIHDSGSASSSSSSGTSILGKKPRIPKSNKPLSYADSLLNMIGLKNKRKYKCNCTSNIDDEDTCQRALNWIAIKYKNNEFPYLKNTYERLLNNDELCVLENYIQIEKDIYRTHPELEYMQPNAQGAKSLERLLKTFSKYDPNIGYVQGMNFIASNLLYHAEEYIAFWLFVMILEMFEMRDIYLPNLPGLSKHCQIIDILMLNNIPDLYLHFCKYDVNVGLFCTEWILALFGTIIPIEKMGYFFDNLLKEGWPFFYKLVDALLNHYKDELLNEIDFMKILLILKNQNNYSNKVNNLKKRNSTTSAFSQSATIINWEILFNKASSNKNLDTKFISNMHLHFDSEKQTFKINPLDTEML